MDNIMVRTTVYNQKGKELGFCEQIFLEGMSGELGNQTTFINSDGDFQLVIYQTTVNQASVKKPEPTKENNE